MGQQVRCIYASKMSEQHRSSNDVLSILKTSISNNAKTGLTGVLLVNRECFLQVLEGPKFSVEHTYRKIKRDDRHTNITLISEEDIQERWFSNWSMGLCRCLDDESESSVDWTKLNIVEANQLIAAKVEEKKDQDLLAAIASFGDN